MDKKNKNYEKIIEDLRLKYEECLQTLNAIRSGDVDAIVVQNGKEDKVYSLKDAQSPYRILVEKMNEGAVTISTKGLIFYCNKQLSNILEIPIEELIGNNIDKFIKKSDHSHFMFFLKNLENKEGKIEVELVRKSNGKGKNYYIPVLISGNFLTQDGIKYLVLIITNLTEYKQRARILKSEWFSRTILEQSANIIFVTDLYGNVLRTSIQAMKILVKQKKFLPPNWHIDIFLKDFRLVLRNKELNDPKIECMDFSLLLSNKIKNGDEIELVNGEITKNFLISYNIIKDNKQKLGYSISLTEITELKRAEEKLIEGEEKYRFLFESMSQSFLLGKIIYDNKFKPVDFIYLEVNKAWQDTMGFPKSKIIGKRAYEIFPNLDPNWLKIFGDITIKSKPIVFEQFGSITGKWFNILAYPQKNDCFAAILEDVTQQKIQEEKILSLSKFPSEDPNPVLRVDKNLKIIYSNKPGEKILNNLGVTDLSVPKTLTESLNLSLKKNKNNLMTTELKIGRSIYEFTIIPVKKTNYFNIYGRDITETKQIEKIKLRALQDKILQMERKKIARELHDNVSQNLFSSSLFSESILKSWGKDPNSALKNLEIIRDLNRSALSEIRILVTNMMPERIANTTLKDLIEGMLNSIKNQSGIKTDMIFDADHELSKNVKKEVYHIVQESLNNVLKHSEATNVKAITELDHNKLKIVISDNGKGFNLSDKSEKRKFGLNIMRERAKSIGASINVNSTPNKGTTITLLKKN